MSDTTPVDHVAGIRAAERIAMTTAVGDALMQDDAQAETIRQGFREITDTITALAAEREALRAYARALEWHLRQQYGVDDDHPVFDQIRKAHNAAALMDADR